MILWDLVRKDVTLLARARSSALVIILGPLVLIFLAGLAFDNANVYNVRVASYAPDESPLAAAFVTALSESRFKVQSASSVEACQAAVLRGDAHACMAFSRGFDVGSSGEVTFYVDYSRMNLVGAIVDVLSTKVGLRTTELSRNLSAAVLSALDVTRSTVRQKRGTLVALATQNDDLSKSIGAAQAAIDGLDFTFDLGGFNSSGLLSQGLAPADRWASFANDSVPKLNGMLVLLARAKADVNASSLDNSSKANLTFDLDAVSNQTLLVRSFVTNASVLNAADRDLLNTSVASLAASLAAAQVKADAAGLARLKASESLSAVKRVLDQSLLQVLDMQKGINLIDQALSSVQVTDAGVIAQPVRTVVKPVAVERTYLNYLFPSLLVLVVAFTALLLAPSLVLFERRSSAVFRNFMAPVHDAWFVTASFVTSVFVLLVQVAVILGVASLVFSLPLKAVLPSIVPALLLVVLFVLLGMVLGFAFNTHETANLAGITLASALLFLSDVLIPVESMPEWLSSITRLNPVVVGGAMVRKVLLFEMPLSQIGGGLLIIAGYALFAAALLLAVHEVSKRHLVSKLFRPKRGR